MQEPANRDTVAYLPTGQSARPTFDALLVGERHWLVRLCTRFTGNLDVAEDLAQETLVAAWKDRHKLKDYEDEEVRRRWLAVIARHMCLRWARIYSRDVAHLRPATCGEDSFELEDIPADAYGVEIELERHELAQLLARALDHLPLTLSSALLARYVDELSHSAILERLGLNEDALVQRLYRGKLALRRVLTSQMSDELTAYGLHLPGYEPQREKTLLWCPMCGREHIIKLMQNGGKHVSFICASCCHLGGMSRTDVWQSVSSAASTFSKQTVWLSAYYWGAIERKATCIRCGAPAFLSIRASHELPSRYAAIGEQPGIAITCTRCGHTHFNTLSHLTFDLLAVQRFWQKHVRVYWHPGPEIEYAGQPAIVSSFQSLVDAARIDVIVQRDTFEVLAIH